MKITDDMITAACAATILGEDEDGKPVHLEPREAHAALTAALQSAADTPPSPYAHSRVIAGVTVDVLLDQCERLAEPIRASTKSFQYASALDNCVAVIRALRGTDASPQSKECPAFGGSGRMGPFFPGGISSVCGNCADPSPQPNVVRDDLLPIYAEGGIGARLLDAMEAYRKEYVFSPDEGSDHEPTEWEQTLLEDFLNGAFNEEVSAILQEAARANLAATAQEAPLPPSKVREE
jgi:hypothetical protein